MSNQSNFGRTWHYEALDGHGTVLESQELGDDHDVENWVAVLTSEGKEVRTVIRTTTQGERVSVWPAAD